MDYADEVIPYAALRVSGMMRTDEKKMLYHAVRTMVPQGTDIIDAGAFMGSSAAIMAAAVAARPDAHSFLKRVHSYDMFVAHSATYTKYTLETVPINGSFLPHYLENTKTYADYINVYPGNFCQFKWIGRPISFFFCDISKAIGIEAHVWRTFLPAFVPGETLFLQQDFVHCEAHYVQIVLGCLADHFEFMAVADSSLLMRYKKEATVHDANLAVQLYLKGSLIDKTDRIDRLIEKLRPLEHDEATATMLLIKASLCARGGDIDAGRSLLAHVKAIYGELPNKSFHARIRRTGDVINTAV